MSVLKQLNSLQGLELLSNLLHSLSRCECKDTGREWELRAQRIVFKYFKSR